MNELMLKILTPRNDGCNVKITCGLDKRTVRIELISSSGEVFDYFDAYGETFWDMAHWLVSRRDF